MKALKYITFLAVSALIFFAGIGVNITEHNCSVCGTHDIHFFNFTEKINSKTEAEPKEQACCYSDKQNDCHSNIKCCEFNNIYLKIINLFSSDSLKIKKDQTVTATVYFNKPTDIISEKNKNITLFLPLKIPNYSLTLKVLSCFIL